MRKRILFFCVFLFFLLSVRLMGQTFQIKDKILLQEKEQFLQNLKKIPAEPDIVHSIARYFDSEVNAIYSSIYHDLSFGARDRDKAVRSLIFFIKELDRHIKQHLFDVYSIPAAVKAYENVLIALAFRRVLTPILAPLEPRISQLMAAAFSQYKEYELLDDIAVYKRVASSPEFILQFLENKPGFRFADSLLIDAAAYDPQKIVFYMNKEGIIRDRVRSTTNIYLRQIASLSEDKQVSELLPFVSQIAELKMEPALILETRKEATGYFQMLVNTLNESVLSGNSNSIFLKPLRNGIKQKANAFYVKEINDLHASAESTRFISVKGLRPLDLYYIITSCSEELYTSSYLGLYKRLMNYYAGQPADSLFDLVGYDNFRIFIRLAANYNVLDDFLQSLSPDRMKKVMGDYITGIEKDESSGLAKAMDIADSFSAADSVTEISQLIETELRSNLDRCRSGQQYLGMRLYSILSEIFSQLSQKNGAERLWEKLGDYEVLKQSALVNEKNEIVELVLFYGDEDGVSSFSNFLKFFTDKSKWEIRKNESWVFIRSLSDTALTIYANLPLDIKEELDQKAQDQLLAHLKEQSLEPTIIVHRGHSYHLDKTLKRLSPSVRLAILGSCGGYNKALSIANINPDVHVIGSKKTGAMSINDPILAVINETLISKKDLLWPEIWKQLSDRFSKDETSLNLFNEYFAPSHNLSLFVLRLFLLNRDLKGTFL